MEKSDLKKLRRFITKVGIKQVVAYSCASIDWKSMDKSFCEDMIVSLLKCSKLIGDKAGLSDRMEPESVILKP